MDEAERCSHVGYIHSSKLIAFGRPHELKTMGNITPPGHQRWEVITDQPSLALGTLKNAAGVADATLFGRSIHALLHFSVDEPAISSVLSAKGIDVQAMRVIEPSLEDVFVMLTRKHVQQMEAGGES